MYELAAASRWYGLILLVTVICKKQNSQFRLKIIHGTFDNTQKKA